MGSQYMYVIHNNSSSTSSPKKADTVEQRQRELEAFFNQKLTPDAIAEEYEGFLEIGEIKWAEEFKSDYPNLLNGIRDSKEWKKYIDNTYVTLWDSGLCSFRNFTEVKLK